MSWEKLMNWTLEHESRSVVALNNEPPTLAVEENGDSMDDFTETGVSFTEAAEVLWARISDPCGRCGDIRFNHRPTCPPSPVKFKV